MINVGEQLVASYLQYIRECEFTQMNLYTVDSQGEIDVVGIDLERKKSTYARLPFTSQRACNTSKIKDRTISKS